MSVSQKYIALEFSEETILRIIEIWLNKKFQFSGANGVIFIWETNMVTKIEQAKNYYPKILLPF